MNTMVGFTTEQETDSTGKVLQSLLFLVRNFLNQTEVSIQPRHFWDAQQSMPNVPPRVWRRHSALLTLLANHAELSELHHSDAE
jgi:hypothetical protein